MAGYYHHHCHSFEERVQISPPEEYYVSFQPLSNANSHHQSGYSKPTKHTKSNFALRYPLKFVTCVSVCSCCMSAHVKETPST